METYMRRGLISRGAVAVTDSDGRLIAVSAYTFEAQDVENTSVLDDFRFASVSKSLTAMAVMALIEDDRTIETHRSGVGDAERLELVRRVVWRLRDRSL